MPSGWSTFVTLFLIGCSPCDGDHDHYTTGQGDCDDADPGSRPSAAELCNGEDDDCDGAIDEDAVDAPTWYELEDADGDGYWGPKAALIQCDQPDGYFDSYDDCDDAAAGVHPDAIETCGNGRDEDCDGTDVACSTPLASADVVYSGEPDRDQAGMSVEGAGDVNGDGYDDILIGAGYGCAEWTPCTGESYLLLGRRSPSSRVLGDADAIFTAEGAWDYAFHAVGAGDLNGDGFDDVVIGAPGNTAAGELAGAVYVLFGGADSIASSPLAFADVAWVGPPGTCAGSAVAAVGDVNADGFGDILVGASCSNGQRGAAYLVLGGTLLASGSLVSADAKFTGTVDRAAAGAWGEVSGLGDLNGDGFDDMAVGANESNGAVYVFLGGRPDIADSLSGADVKFTGEGEGDRAERGAPAGDVNGDGYADLVIGAFEADVAEPGGGAAYLVLGTATGYSGRVVSLVDADAVYAGEGADDMAGIFVAGPGDVDADGYDDLFVSAVLADSSGYCGYDTDGCPGAAYLVVGGPAPASRSLYAADAKFGGEAASANAFYVGGAGDVDADGYADLLLGAPGNNAAYLFLGGSL